MKTLCDPDVFRTRTWFEACPIKNLDYLGESPYSCFLTSCSDAILLFEFLYSNWGAERANDPELLHVEGAPRSDFSSLWLTLGKTFLFSQPWKASMKHFPNHTLEELVSHDNPTPCCGVVTGDDVPFQVPITPRCTLRTICKCLLLTLMLCYLRPRVLVQPIIRRKRVERRCEIHQKLDARICHLGSSWLDKTNSQFPPSGFRRIVSRNPSSSSRKGELDQVKESGRTHTYLPSTLGCHHPANWGT